MKRNFIVSVFLALAFSACGKTEVIPTGPTPPPPPPPPPPVTVLSGRIVSYGDNQPVSRSNVNVHGSETVQADEAGNFQLTSQNPINFRLTISAPGFVSRSTGFKNDGVTIDLIKEVSPFDGNFFSQFGRNGLGQIQRQTQSRSYYIRTVDEYTGQDLPRQTIDAFIAIIHQVTSQQTAGRFQVLGIEEGREKRDWSVNGPVVVSFTSDPGITVCGQAGVGLVRITSYGRSNCSCGSSLGFTPRIAAHELGHNHGFYHHNQSGIMNPNSSCANSGTIDFSPAERFHAGIVYSRPNGNTHPDNDPSDHYFSTTGNKRPLTENCFDY